MDAVGSFLRELQRESNTPVRDEIEATVGSVTAKIGPEVADVGEVKIPYHGGSETFHAYAFEAGQVFEVGSEVIIIKRIGPRTVRVVAYPKEAT